MAEGLPLEAVTVGIGPDGKLTYEWWSGHADARNVEATDRAEQPAA
jgi:hypothetical protein